MIEHPRFEPGTDCLSGRWLKDLLPYGPIARHETHSGMVLVTGDLAFKIRKDVNLGFLDYSTLPKRWEAFQREFNLGRRISPELYQGLWSMVNQGTRLEPSIDPEGEPVLVMKALSEELRLDKLLVASELSPETRRTTISTVSRECADFHERCPTDTDLNGYGTLQATRRAWEVNFTELPEDRRVPLTPEERHALIEDTKAWFYFLSPILERRIETGRIREGHGDLKLEHVYCTRPHWSVIDPLEFSKELRFTDTAAEVGFLAMDLDALDLRTESHYLVREYVKYSGDFTLPHVLPFFKRYRAVVQAKIRWLRSQQLAGEDRALLLQESRKFFELALSYRLTAPLE